MRLIVAVCLCHLVVVENLVVGLSTQKNQEETTITPVLDSTNSDEESTDDSLEEMMPNVEAEYVTETTMPLAENNEEHLLPNTEDVDETESNKPVLGKESLVDDGEEVEMPVRHVAGETDTGGSGVDAEDTTDDTLEITVPIRHGENETESKEPVSEDLEQDYGEATVPVRHDENEGDDTLYEYGELQHDYDYESMTPEERKQLRKKCKPRRPCKDLGGKCRRRKAGCNAGNFIYESTHNVKYCNKRSCVCCVPVVRCKANTKCSSQNGKCIWEGERCAGKVKKGKAFCDGKDCVCCIPKKPKPVSCLTKYACHDLKGTCINLWKETCHTKVLVGKEFCKGKDCGCCLSAMPVTTECVLQQQYVLNSSCPCPGAASHRALLCYMQLVMPSLQGDSDYDQEKTLLTEDLRICRGK